MREYQKLRYAEKPQHHRSVKLKWRDNPVNREKGNKAKRDRHARLRKTVLDAYGHLCRCCGEARVEFLALDHVDGLPDHHRQPSGKRRSFEQIYTSVIKEGFPEDYQILCHNCNTAKGLYGQCPHQSER